MPSLSQHSSGKLTKVLVIGDSATGKTSALISLVKAGYKLRILDMDNGIDPLAYLVRQQCPELMDNVQFVSYRDKVKMKAGGVAYDGPPKAFRNAMQAMDKWPEDDSIPAEWGPEYVFVLDTMTFLGEAAYAWQDQLNPSAKDKRQIYGAAQESVENVLALLTSPDFNTNVVVISHVRYQERQDGQIKGYPSAIGGALSTRIGTYFNSVLMAESTGSGSNAKKVLRTTSTNLIDLKSPGATEMGQSLPLETGLADFFAKHQIEKE